MNGTPPTDIQAVLRGRADYTFDQPSARQLRQIDLRSPGLLHTEPLPDTEWLDLTRAGAVHRRPRPPGVELCDQPQHDRELYGGPDSATPTCQIIPVTIPGHVPYAPTPATRPRTGAGARRTSHALANSSRCPAPAVRPSRWGPRPIRSSGRARREIRRPGATPTRLPSPARRGHRGEVATVPFPTSPDRHQQLDRERTVTVGLDHHFTRLPRTGPPERSRQPSRVLRPRDRPTRDPSYGTAGHRPRCSRPAVGAPDREITNLAPWVPTVTQTENDIVSAHVGDYQYVPTIGALLDQLWVR